MSGSSGSIWSVARRRLGFEANALRRPSDRFQARARIVLLLIFLLSCVVAVLAGRAVYERDAERARLDRDAGYHATASVVSSEVTAADPQSGATQQVVEISWRDGRDELHRQRLIVPEGRRLGSALPVWVDASGHASLRQPPENRGVGSGIGAGAFVLLVSTFLLVCSYGLVVLALNRRRMTAWERQWSVVEPEWRRRAL